jgi:hypothetical protein
MRRSFTVLAAVSLLVGLLVSPASAATGTWEQYPTGAASYFAEVQQPINSANTSNWSAKSKGGIPVMYKLFTGTGPAAFESIYSTVATEDDFAYVSFSPSAPLLFNDIETLKTDYSWVIGDCHGGSLRWSVRTSPTQSVFIYYGSPSEFGNGGVDGCNPALGGVNQSGTNMIGFSDLRYDTSQYPGGTFYDTYSHAQTLVGTTPVIRVSLVIDSGWVGCPDGDGIPGTFDPVASPLCGDQRLNISNTTVNTDVYDFVSAGGGSVTATCDLPDAFIDVTKLAPVADGIVNETTVYPQSATDTSKQFRVVDCKYQYVLSIPSLKGTGTYDVEILIDGNPVATDPNSLPDPSEVRFDLK